MTRHDRNHLSLLRRRLRRQRRGRAPTARCGVGRRGASGQFRPAVRQGLGAGAGADAGGAPAASAIGGDARELGRRARPRRRDVSSETIAAHGPDSVAFYVSGQLLTEDYYVANKLMKGFIGSANIDTNSRLCMSSSVAGHKRAFGADTVPGCYEDLELADLVVLVGSNLAWCHPVLFQRLAAARERRGGLPKIVNIDPRRTATSEIADLQLSLAPGSDVALFSGLLRELNQRRQAREEIHRRSHRGRRRGARRRARTGRSKRSPPTTGLTPRGPAAASTISSSPTTRRVTVYSQGVNQSSAGTDKVNAIINTHLLTGRIGKPGCGPFSVTGQPNAMGGREVGGLANMLAAHMELDNRRPSRAGAGLLGRAAPSPTSPASRRWTCSRPSTTGGSRRCGSWPPIRSTACPTPISSARRWKNAPSWWSPTSPKTPTPAPTPMCCCRPLAWGEKDGTVTNSERRISRQRSLRAAPGEARADWAIDLRRGASAWVLREAFAFDGPAAIFREHAALSGVENNGARDFDISAFAELSDAAYDALAPFQWPRSRRRCSQATRRSAFSPTAGSSRRTGRANFVATPFRGLAQRPGDGEYPLSSTPAACATNGTR